MQIRISRSGWLLILVLALLFYFVRNFDSISSRIHSVVMIVIAAFIIYLEYSKNEKQKPALFLIGGIILLIFPFIFHAFLALFYPGIFQSEVGVHYTFLLLLLAFGLFFLFWARKLKSSPSLNKR